MSRTHARPGLRGALGLIAALTIAAGGLAAAGGPAAADSSNIEEVRQTADEIRGTATGEGASTGSANTLDMALVNQLNIQVMAGDAEAQANSSQTAANAATIDQNNTAASGDATTDGSGSAQSGSATAGSIALVQQLNIQVAYVAPGCVVEQDAANTADIDQSAAAVSGTAEAANGGDANTGDASALNVAQVRQRNVQVDICRDGSARSQAAENIAEVQQATGAGSGNATANGGSAETGDARSRANDLVDQANRQINR